VSAEELEPIIQMLEDEKFTTMAPAQVVEKERQKREALVDKIERLKQQIQKY